MYETHPIANSQFVYYVGHGAITPVPDVARFTADSVELTDGRRIEPDLVDPGHRIPAAVRVPQRRICSMWTLRAGHSCTCTRSRRRIRRWPWPACCNRIPDCSRWSHWQSVAIARLLRLREAAPEQAAAFWRARQSDVGSRFNGAKVKQSTRHWFEVSHVDYLRALEKTLRELENVS